MDKIITDINAAKAAGLLRDGRYFIRVSDGTPLFLPIWYGNRVDLGNLLLFTGNEVDAHPEIPDLNELVSSGLVREATVYRCHDIDLPKFRDCRATHAFGQKHIRQVLDEFREHGFNVTREAVMHNYKAWYADLKSGYRDEENGYHLFTPCGCNPLSFRVTSLEDCLDWQTTYQG